MTRHEQVAAYVRRICPDAAELLEMMGVTVDGIMQPDDERDIAPAAAGPEVRKSAAIERPVDMNVRPKVSTAPDSLRNLPAIPVVAKPKPAPKPKREHKATNPDRVLKRRQTQVGSPAQAQAARTNGGSRLAPCGKYGAYRRHLRNNEPVDELCQEAAREQWRNRGHRPRLLALHGTYTAVRRHRRLGEPPCDLCAAAKSTSAEDRARYISLRRKQGIEPRQLVPCGSEGAYRRHLKQKTPVCDECRAAHNERNRQLEAAKRDAA